MTVGRVSTVVFDLDGTLVDSADDILTALREACSMENHQVPATLNRGHIGPPVGGILKNLCPDIRDDVLQRLVKAFRGLYDESPMPLTVRYEGVMVVLESLKSSGIGCFVATNKPKKPTQMLLNRYFDGYIDGFVCVDSVEGAKLSKAEMIDKLIRDQMLDVTGAVYIGDSVSDIDAARENKCLSVAALYGYGESKELRESRPDYCINAPIEFLQLEAMNRT